MPDDYTDARIDYTNYLGDKPQETDHAKLAAMKAALVQALKRNGVHGHISCKYFKDGVVEVSINGEYYNLFDSNTGKFFSGCVGD